MRILIAHNRYQQSGGEDTAVANEIRLLEEHGHTVDHLCEDNDSIHGLGGAVAAAGRAFFSIPSWRSVRARIDGFRPDLLHVHNFHPTLSPSVFYAAAEKRVPVVLTLHNYRVICANAQLFREGKPCELCVSSRSFLPGARHACYRGSHAGSAVVGANMAIHAAVGTWTKRIDRYIALTEFAARKLSDYRIPYGRVRIKPNSTPDSGVGEGGGGFALFAGRLSPEKGIQTLIEADRNGLLPMPVFLAGDGPLRDLLQSSASRRGSRLHPVGVQSREELRALMCKASVLVVPSVWYEGFPLVCVEALATGLPILCSRIGGLPELVVEGSSGRLFPPGDATGMAEAMRHFVDGSDAMLAMRIGARLRYEAEYTQERNYEMLMKIYGEIVPEG